MLVTALLFSTLNAQLSTAHAQGSLMPPGAPGPTMKSLDQIEARTPISSVPFTIANPGSYYLTTNVTVSTGNAITINANNVTLDLNGFTISSTQNPAATGHGIQLGGVGGVTNITILNGIISSGVTNNSGGVYGGSGFGYGISFSSYTPYNVRVLGVLVSGCLYDGINGGDNSKAESCAVNVAGSVGIASSSVSDSTALNCGNTGIEAEIANNCYGNGYSTGVSAGRTANNCFGVGYSPSFSYGVYAAGIANNCYGIGSGGGIGLSAITADNCYGYGSGSAWGLYANTANNCFGQSSGSGTGLGAGIAIGCYGVSGSGKGLAIHIANSCFGSPTVSIDYPYNMP